MNLCRDPRARLVVGDCVRVGVEGDRLLLHRPDGKDIKATIIRREREDFFGRFFARE